MHFFITPRLLILINKFGDKFVNPFLWQLSRRMKFTPPQASNANQNATKINPPINIKVYTQKVVCLIKNIKQTLRYHVPLFRKFDSRSDTKRGKDTSHPVNQFISDKSNDTFHSQNSTIGESIESTKRESNPTYS